MAEKEQQQLATATTNVRSDVEAATADSTEAAYADSKELRRKKRMKCLLYVVAFAIFQTGIILLFALTIMKIRTPKFRLRSATFENFNVGTPANSSFDLTMNAQLGIKNTNFGGFKYQNTTMNFFYGGAQVGEVFIPKSSVGWRTTKKINVVVKLSSASLPSENSQLGTDLSKGLLPLTSQSTLKGKIELMKFLFKKKKTIQMNCTMEVVIASRELSNIVCK